MRPTTADDNVFDFNALLHPGTVFETPGDVLDHPALTLAEKRAILASWASTRPRSPLARRCAHLPASRCRSTRSWTRCVPWTVAKLLPWQRVRTWPFPDLMERPLLRRS